MIPYIDIDLEQPISFYDEYDLTPEEVEILLTMVDDDNLQEAIDYFINGYISPPGIKYQDALSRYLLQSSTGPLKSEDRDKLTRNIAILTLGITSLLYSNYNTFTKKVYSDYLFKSAGLDSGRPKRALIDEFLTEFDQNINGVFNQTQLFITNSIKNLQTEIFTLNAYLSKNGVQAGEADIIINNFFSSIKKKYPQIYKAIKENKILVVTKYGEDAYRTKHFKVDNYLDLYIRDNLYNFDRTANTMAATIAGERVVEFYLADARSVKKDRQICQEILANKVNGVSILALDEEAADKLGVMTISEAESTPDFYGGPNCRHSVKRLSKSYLNEINKILEGK